MRAQFNFDIGVITGRCFSNFCFTEIELTDIFDSSKGEYRAVISDRFGARLLHGSVSTAETPDVMCSLETFVTV